MDGSTFSKTTPTLASLIWYWRHPSGYQVVSCGLALNFPNDKWCSVSFHRLNIHSPIFREVFKIFCCIGGDGKEEVSVQVKCLILILRLWLSSNLWSLSLTCSKNLILCCSFKLLSVFAFSLVICMSSWTVDENPLLAYGLKIFSPPFFFQAFCACVWSGFWGLNSDH